MDTSVKAASLQQELVLDTRLPAAPSKVHKHDGSYLQFCTYIWNYNNGERYCAGLHLAHGSLKANVLLWLQQHYSV